MLRQCWVYSQAVPVMQIVFQTLTGTHVTETLEVDYGATGGVSCFILDEND